MQLDVDVAEKILGYLDWSAVQKEYKKENMSKVQLLVLVIICF